MTNSPPLLKSSIFWQSSEEKFLEALLLAANSERFFPLREGKSKFYWRSKRRILAQLYVSKFGELPRMFFSRVMPLSSAKTTYRWSVFKEQIRMIKLIEARYQGDFQVALSFSDGKEGIFDGHSLLQRSGPLLDPLRDEAYFRRLFIDAGALCWPNGLELSPARLHETCRTLALA